MQTYTERAVQLGVNSSIAVYVLMGSSPQDVEFLPLKPRMADEAMLAELKTRWAGRSLRSVGVIGLVGTTPQCALEEPLEPDQITGLGAAFLAYLHVILSDSFAAQQETVEISELERLYSLPDTRLN